MARHYGVSLHTHLAENDNDIAYSREKFGMTPAEYAEDLGWVGHDVWHAHCVQLDDAGIELFARTGTGVAHCPCSNMRLASGIAPVSGCGWRACRWAWAWTDRHRTTARRWSPKRARRLLLQRVGFGPDAMTAREALEIATLGGAKVLGRDDIGALAPGMAADFVSFDLRSRCLRARCTIRSPRWCSARRRRCAYSVIGGKVVVKKGSWRRWISDR